MKEIKDLGFGIIQVNEPKPTMSKMESVDNYRDMWQKLKEWVEKAILRNKDNIISKNDYENVLVIMQELEAEDE